MNHMTQCEMTGMLGECGLDCPVFLLGDCGEPDELLEILRTDNDFTGKEKQEILSYYEKNNPKPKYKPTTPHNIHLFMAWVIDECDEILDHNEDHLPFLRSLRHRCQEFIEKEK